MDNKKCVMCKREVLKQMVKEERISIDEYNAAIEEIMWEIKKSPHRVRLVCSRQCFDDLKKLMENVKELEKPVKTKEDKEQAKKEAFAERIREAQLRYQENLKEQEIKIESKIMSEEEIMNSPEYKKIMGEIDGIKYELPVLDFKSDKDEDEE